MSWKNCLLGGLLIFSGNAALAKPLPENFNFIDKILNVKFCYNFKEPRWVFASNKPAEKWPKVSKGVLTLLPDDLANGAAAAILKRGIRPPFEATFEFRTFDEDGGPQYIWNSADGLSFFFYKDGSRYGTPPHGSFMGFASSGGGYAVQMPTYGQRRIRLRAASGLTFQTNPFRQAYTHGEWVPMKVRVYANRVQAWSGERKLLDVALNFDTEFTSMGFSAATGDADSEHQVRKFCIGSIRGEKQPKPESEQETPKEESIKKDDVTKESGPQPKEPDSRPVKEDRPAVPEDPAPVAPAPEPEPVKPASAPVVEEPATPVVEESADVQPQVPEESPVEELPVVEEPEIILPSGPIERYVPPEPEVTPPAIQEPIAQESVAQEPEVQEPVIQGETTAQDIIEPEPEEPVEELVQEEVAQENIELEADELEVISTGEEREDEFIPLYSDDEEESDQ